MTALLGVDIGTSACKAALFTPDGHLLAAHTEPYGVDYPQPGWAQQHPDTWWRAAVQAIRRLTSEAVVPPNEIAAVGVDGQSWAVVLVDGEDRALCPSPLWMDTRAAALCADLRRDLGEDNLFALSGNPLQPSYTLPKLLWIRQHWPDVTARATGLLQSNGWIVLRLTGVRSQDLSQAYGLHCFDMRAGRWSGMAARAFDIPESWLPKPVESHTIVGHVTPEAARETGLAIGTPVVAGGLDAACGTLGAGVWAPGQTQEQGGQASGMSICLDAYRADPRLILSRHVVPGRFLLQGGSVGGGALRWFREAVCADGMTFAALDEAAAQVPPGADGVVFLPYLSGERSPIWDPDARGVFFGLQYRHGRAHMARAILEGVAYSLRHNLETAQAAGAAVSTLHAMGGAAGSAVWTQIKSDVTGLPILVPDADTATALGAALLAGIGAGVYPGFGEAVQATLRIRRRHTPDERTRPAYDAAYRLYRNVYESIKGVNA